MSDKKISRRNFLKVAGITLAATTVTCVGLGYAATLTPKIETPELVFEKDKNMTDHILVTYATRAGSTSEIATAIGEAISKRGFAVDVKPIKEKPSLQGYRAVLMGSAIRMGSWLPEAADFIKANQQELKQMPVALFTVHMQNTGEDEASRTARLAYLGAIRPLLNQAEEVYFTGKMELSRLSFFDRSISKMLKAKDEDLRDWNKIRSWVPAILS